MKRGKSYFCELEEFTSHLKTLGIWSGSTMTILTHPLFRGWHWSSECLVCSRDLHNSRHCRSSQYIERLSKGQHLPAMMSSDVISQVNGQVKALNTIFSEFSKFISRALWFSFLEFGGFFPPYIWINGFHFGFSFSSSIFGYRLPLLLFCFFSFPPLHFLAFLFLIIS